MRSRGSRDAYGRRPDAGLRRDANKAAGVGQGVADADAGAVCRLVFAGAQQSERARGARLTAPLRARAAVRRPRRADQSDDDRHRPVAAVAAGRRAAGGREQRLRRRTGAALRHAGESRQVLPARVGGGALVFHVALVCSVVDEGRYATMPDTLTMGASSSEFVSVARLTGVVLRFHCGIDWWHISNFE